MATTVFPKPSGWASATEDIPFVIQVSDWTAVTGGYQAEIVNTKFNTSSIELITYTISVAEYLTANISKSKDAANNKLIFFTASLPTGTISGNICCINNLSTSVSASEKGIANGVATLDGNGLIPSNQLPSYVDDVQEYASVSAFPATGEIGKIYVAIDTNKSYRWSGSTYVELSSYALATDSAAGLMAATDKSKLDGIAAGATANVVSNSLTDDSTTNALSAAQGKALNDNITNDIGRNADSSDLDDQSTRFVRINGNTLNTPYKAGLAQGQTGISILSTNGTPGNWCTQLVLVDGGYEIFVRFRSNGTWRSWESLALNSKIEPHNLGSYSSLSSLEADLTSYGNSLGDSEKRNIRIAVTSTFGLFHEVNVYLGTICKKETDRFIIQLQTTSAQYGPVLGFKSVGGNWAWDELALDSEIKNELAYGSIATNCDIEIRRMFKANGDTLNTPYKQGITSSREFYVINTQTQTTNSWCQQFALTVGNNVVFVRNCSNGTWSDWFQLALNNRIDNLVNPLPDNTNIDNIKRTCFAFVQSPSSSSFSGDHSGSLYSVFNVDGSRGTQTIVGIWQDKIWSRRYTGEWQAWKEITLA